MLYTFYEYQSLNILIITHWRIDPLQKTMDSNLPNYGVQSCIILRLRLDTELFIRD